ncbi:MAG: hypothetical protein SGI92_25315 [Bryobacteraceae bacterium]|nr:hypothetical protein [Bryobacteraceae bacterium]
MNELKEIRIGDERLMLRDNLVRSSILPRGSSELARDITLQGNVVVEGSLFARNLEIEDGPADLMGAVYVQEEIHLRTEAKGVVRFRKAVASSGPVVCLSPSARVWFGADLNARVVRLRNAFVAASIFAEEIELDNCVVMGGVFATRRLSLNGCIAGTFNSPAVRASLANYLLYPSAFSVEPIALLPGTTFHNLTLADLGSLFCGTAQKTNTGKIVLDMEVDAQRSVLVDDSRNTFLVNSYSVASKVLAVDLIDLDQMQNHFLLSAASLGSQLLKTYDLGAHADGTLAELTTERVAAFFFSILEGRVEIADLDGSIDIEEIKRAFA